jgi:hypothetical protein
MTTPITNITPAQKRRDDKLALRTRLLAELTGKPRTTNQLAVAVEIDRGLVYHAMQALEQEGVVKGFNDRRRTVLGDGGRVWSLCDEQKRPAPPPPARDPLLWAMFGGQP